MVRPGPDSETPHKPSYFTSCSLILWKFLSLQKFSFRPTIHIHASSYIIYTVILYNSVNECGWTWLNYIHSSCLAQKKVSMAASPPKPRHHLWNQLWVDEGRCFDTSLDGSEPYTYRSLGFNFSENLAKNPVFFAIIREHLGFRFKFGKKQDPVHDGRSANQYKGQFVSFQVSNWVGSCMAWPAMTMTIYWHLYVNLWYKHGYSITTVCDTSIWSHFSPFPKMEPLQTKTSLWHSHEFNGCKFVFSRHSGSWETPMSKESSTSIFARKAEYW